MCVVQEVVGNTPGWFAGLMTGWRHGVWVGRGADVPVPWVGVHIHAWHLQVGKTVNTRGNVVACSCRALL